MAEFFVYDDAYGYAGKCYFTGKRGRVSSVFSYAPEYIATSGVYNIDPTFQMIEGSQFSDSAIPRAFADSAPDRWGRNLIYKGHVYESQLSGTSARALSDVDYLLGVSDTSRQGSIRYKSDRAGVFVHASEDIPKLIALPKLLNSTKALASQDSNEAIKYLLDAGSASLGGARPKAVVDNNGKLYIAKFPHIHDEWDVISWEYVALSIARMAGIDTPDFELVDIEGNKVLLTKRFDRYGGDNTRIGYISAMTLLQSDDGQTADYSDLCLQMGDVCVDYRNDLRELYRRILLSVLINNTDDHLRNHGFLRVGSGWRLSPVFDINPNPNRGAARATSIYGAATREAQMRVLQDNCADFMLNAVAAESVLKEVQSAAKAWRDIAARAGIHRHEIDMMRGAFG
jgi:serine/threonine-protein kinase HipA